MSQNRLILHQTEERGGGSVRTQIERGMPPIETSIRKALEAVHSRNFEKKEIPAILSDQFRYRKTHYAYIKEALSKGIGLDDILSFHDEKVEMDLRKLWAPRSGGQKPSKILHVNSSEERSAEILSEGAAADEKGRYSGGAFVVSINVRKESHAPEDFQPSAYMNGHLIKHDAYALPYELFIASFGGEAEKRGSTPEKEISLVASRRDAFVKRYQDAGFHVEASNGTPYSICNIGGKLHKTYMPLVLHDTAEAEYYVIDGSKKMLLEEWLGKNGLDRLPSVKKDIEALQSHREEAWYFDEYIQLTSKRKTSKCNDSRENCPQNSARSTIRIIGSILTADERRRVLETPGLEYFTNGLHFGCGYLTTAMKFHEVGMEIRRMFEKGEKEGRGEWAGYARGFFKDSIQKVFSGEWKSMALNTFLTELNYVDGEPLSNASIGMLRELLKSSTADLREIARHMNQRGILAWSEELGTLVMPAAAKIDSIVGEDSKLLPHNRSGEKEKADQQQKAYYDSITVQAAMDVEESWIASFNEVKKTSVKHVRVVIKDYENGISYMVNDNGELIDSFTMKKTE